MEKWKEAFVGSIPPNAYMTQLRNGEEEGLILELKSNNCHVVLKFGMVHAVRMLDEGIVQKELYSDCEIEKFKQDHFKNVIYEVKDGEFSEQIQIISDGYGETWNAKHYVVITQNYNIDIITEQEPEISIY